MDDRVVPIIPKDALTALARRLEAATSRLEDMASATIEAPKINGSSIQSAVPTATLPPAPVAAPETPVAEPLPTSVEYFDTFITGPLKRFVNLSDELGGSVAEQVRASYQKKLAGLMILGLERYASIRWTTEVPFNHHESQET